MLVKLITQSMNSPRSAQRMSEYVGRMPLNFGTAGHCELCSDSIDESKYHGDYEHMYMVACLNCRAVLDRGKDAAVRLVESQLEL